jgi:hypothetical protein
MDKKTIKAGFDITYKGHYICMLTLGIAGNNRSNHRHIEPSKKVGALETLFFAVCIDSLERPRDFIRTLKYQKLLID